MKRIDKYDLSTPEGLYKLLRGYFDICNVPGLKEDIDYLYQPVVTKKRFETITCEQDLINMSKEHSNYCDSFTGECRSGCKYGSQEFNSCFMNFLLEEIEVEITK